MPDFVAAIDQGTTSTRFMIFDHDAHVVGSHQLEHQQLMPRAGWVEHDPLEIWERTSTVIQTGLNRAGLQGSDLAAIGITNQRESAFVWNRTTGRPYGNAIVWQDTRNAAHARQLESGPAGKLIRDRTGLRSATYFSGGKLRWLLEHDDRLRADALAGEAAFGTSDSWLLWNLTGGVHATDVTNASRTMLMDLETLDWDDELLEVFGVPRSMLPTIHPSALPEAYGLTSATGPVGAEVPVMAALGDQQAAMVGQLCFNPGDAKCTYGTGNFMLVNTGSKRVVSEHGLLTTVCYQFGDEPAAYALEGSVAVTGSAVQWLRDQLGVISGAAQSEALAAQVEDTGGVYFVPAFSGLFAPYWRSDARGAIVGLSRFSTNAHLARATLESICYQTLDIAEAIESDVDRALTLLRVDGGVTSNELCMQLQADILGIPVSRSAVAETTALGAAYAAGLARGFWADVDELKEHRRDGGRWEPTWSDDRRTRGHRQWRKAVSRTLDWVEDDDEGNQ